MAYKRNLWVGYRVGGREVGRVPEYYARAFCCTTARPFQICFLQACCSLVPRCFHQFLISCSMQRGKAWSILSREWRQVYLGRQRREKGSPIKWMSLRICCFCPSAGTLNICEVKNTISCSEWKMHAWNMLFSSRAIPPLPHLGRHWQFTW